MRATCLGIVVGVLALCGAGMGAAAAGAGAGPDVRAFSLARIEGEVAVVRLDAAAWEGVGGGGMGEGPFVVSGVPVGAGRTLDLEIERFHVVGPGTRFVLGRLDGPDVPLGFDASEIEMYRGRVAGYPGSRVFLSIAPGSVVGRIDLGPGEGRYQVSHRGGGIVGLREGELAVFAARETGGGTLEVPLCGVGPGAAGAEGPMPRPLPPAPPLDPRGVTPMRGLRHLQLAVETDYELFELFGDAESAATYLVQMYGVVSDIYMRDVSTRITLSFVRLWDDPNDLYNGNESPLDAFRIHWQQNLPAVPRDVAQYFSGRRDLSAGGVAYLSQLCNGFSYSWAGYARGFFADPSTPDWSQRDIMVTAHELGHNCGTGHTHDYGLDICHTGDGPARRGSIMSYCGQGYSGGDANHDLWFHEHTANLMRQYMFSRACIANDCNANGVPDVQDIGAGTSPDANGNGVPDECEDCNGNGVLDPVDIAGPSNDVNNNMIPDECEADCNGNGVPDAFETAMGATADLNANRVPDSCEADCDGNGVADYNQIQADMSLDIDRDAVLDSCQRCTAGPGGPTDFEALDHAWNVYIGMQHGPGVGEFFGGSGVRMATGAAAEIEDTQDLVITPDRRVLVSSFEQNRIAAVGADGTHLGTLIAGGSGGLDEPAGMLLTEAGTLLVASRGNSAVLEFDAQTGAFMRQVVAPGAGGLVQPYGLAFGPGGNLFVSSASDRVFEFDGSTGAFVRVFVTTAGNGGLSDPRGLLFKPDGNLLVCSRLGGNVLEYDGATGAFLGRWNRNGTATVLTLDNPWCIRLGPDGDVYVSRSHSHRAMPGELHQTDARVYRFDVGNGNFVRTYILGEDAGLDGPTGFDFMPGEATDCNMNFLPDACDIASGTSPDRNGNGRPDECDCLADWDSDGSVNSGDISAFLTAWLGSVGGGGLGGDFDGDGLVSSNDISAFLGAWLAAVDGGC